MKRRISVEISCGELYCYPCNLCVEEGLEGTLHSCKLFNRLLSVKKDGPFIHVLRCEECHAGVQIAEDLDGAAILAAIHTPGAIQFPENVEKPTFITYEEINKSKKKTKNK